MRRRLLVFLMSMFPALGLASAPVSGAGFACNMRALTNDERTQHAALARELFAAVQERIELANGYAFRLSAGSWLDVARWADLEQKCCPFFAFKLNAAANHGPLWLEITGRPGAKAFMKEEFGL